MAGENVIHIVGTVGKDPELNYTTGGRAVAKFSVATNRKWKQNDEWKEEATWHSIIAWSDLGENVAASLQKGNRVMVSGRLSIRSYEDREGNTKYSTEIVADNIGAELRFATCVVERIERDKSYTPKSAAKEQPAEEPF
jgi:single-strand DNA-binding protein